MTSKYNTILKIKQIAVDKSEQELAKLNNTHKTLIKELYELESNYHAMSSKNITTGWQLRNYGELSIEAYISKQNKLEEIANFEVSLEEAKQKHKQLVMEFEKIAFLQNEEYKVYRYKLKKQEEKSMGEVAVMLHNQKRLA